LLDILESERGSTVGYLWFAAQELLPDVCVDGISRELQSAFG
jgi:hypothetical protein